MKNLKLREDGDLIIDSLNNLEMVDGDDELIQEIRLSFQENRGEYFLDPSIGFRHYDILGQKPFNRDTARDAAYEVLAGNPRIDSISRLDVSFNPLTRRLYYSFSATKVGGGTISVSEEVEL